MKFAPDRRDALVALFALSALGLGLFAPGTLNDGDTWWHVKVGQWILAHGRAPTVDLWSATRQGDPWTAHEWLAEALMALAYRVGGWAGVVTLCAVTFGSAIWILGQTVARRLEGIALAVVLLLGLSLMTPGLLARPHLLALPLVALWSAELVRARDQGRMPSFWLVPLMTLWANLHGGWAFGLALAGPFGLEALFSARPDKRLSVFLRWAVFGCLCLAAAAVTPFGLEGLLLPVRLIGMKNLGGIGEWRPADFSHLESLEIVLLVLVAFALTRPLRLAPAMAVLLAVLLHVSLSQARHQMLLGIVAPMILCGPLAVTLDSPYERPVRLRLVTWLAVGAALALVILRLAMPLPRVDSPSSPLSAIAAIPASIRAQPVLNQYGFGGYLIWSGIRPFIDSRAELFQDEGLEEYGNIAEGDEAALDAVIATRDFGWAIFSPEAKVNAMLDAKPGWRRLHTDRFAIVHVRQR